MFRLLLAALLLAGPTAFAQDTTGTAPAAPTTKEPAKSSLDTVQTKYNLTEEEMKTLKDSPLKSRDYGRIAMFARESNKPIADIIKMRLEDKMGWGKIAKTLGVHPREIGHAVSGDKHADRREPNAKMDHMKEKHADKMKGKGKGH